MKQPTGYAAAGFILILCTLAACAEGPSQAIPRLRPDPLTLHARNMFDPATFYGDVAFQPADSGASIVVSLDGGERPGLEDGVADQVFVMQRWPNSGRIRSFKIEGATLHYRGRGVLIEAPNPTYTWTFYLRGNGGEETVAAFARERRHPITQTWAVYGISRRTIQWPLTDGYLGRERVREAAGG